MPFQCAVPKKDGLATPGAIKRHFENIITYLKIRITNAGAEGLNSKIQMIKYRARGYRNEGSFERAILFHCGGLDLYPTHSKS
jgi:transposase